MSKAIVTKKCLISDNRALTVVVGNPTTTVLVLDCGYNLYEDLARDTFINLCYTACRYNKKGAEFVYVGCQDVTSAAVKHVIEEVRPDSIIIAASELTRAYGITDPQFLFASLRLDTKLPTAVVVPFATWSDAAIKDNKVSTGTALFGYTLRGMIEAVAEKPIIDVPDTTFATRKVYTIKAFKQIMELVVDSPVVSLDIEGTSLNRYANTILTIQLGIETENGIECFFIPIQHKDTPWNNKELTYIKQVFKAWLLNTKSTLLAHSAQYDLTCLMVWLELDFVPISVYDTIAAQFLLDENAKFLRNGIYGIRKPYSLEFLEKQHGIYRHGALIDKDDRGNMSAKTLNEIYLYSLWDVASLLWIRKRQLALAVHPIFGYPSKKAFTNTVIHQLGVMIKTFCILHKTGIAVDVAKAVDLASPSGPFAAAIDEIYQKLLDTKAGKKANAILLKRRGASGSGLFKKSKTLRALSLTKPEHKDLLFFDVLGLEPVSIGKSGQGSTDSAFQKRYGAMYPEVALYREFNTNSKLKSAFANALVTKITTDLDYKHVRRVLSNFGFSSVISGRLNSYDLNMQQIPSRGELSKKIKAAFVATKGNVMIGTDFSSHEVRVAGMLAHDEIMLQTFIIIHSIVKDFRLGSIPTTKEELDKLFADLEQKIDVHILNAQSIYGIKITKSSPLRSSIKNVVFSIIYGAMAPKIAKTTQGGEVQAALDTKFNNQRMLRALAGDLDDKAVDDKLKKLLENSTKKELKAKLLNELDHAEEVLARPFEHYLNQAEEAFNKISHKWHVLWDWMDTVKKVSMKTFHAVYPNGRIRHLFGFASADVWVHRAMERRAVNSVVQGFASDIGVLACYTGQQWVFENCYLNELPFEYSLINLVHDAKYHEIPFEKLPLALYLTEHTMSTLPYEYLLEKFNFRLPVQLGYDLDFGLSWDTLKEWKKHPELLYSMITELGGKMNKSAKEIAKVVEDAKTIWKWRSKELQANEPTMYLRGERFLKVADTLNMFR